MSPGDGAKAAERVRDDPLHRLATSRREFGGGGVGCRVHCAHRLWFVGEGE